SAEKVDELSRKYENMSFLMAHSGSSYDTVRNNLKVVKKRENVYLEITYTSLTNGIIEYMVEEAGAERVIFGTDMPYRDPAPQLAWVCYAKISIEDKKKILGENILKLIKRCYT
ncbi:MAG: amidohydrolase family protein, partial [Clostridiales bacterium]|nr:amidohydrolase family protein [Clostridiales bacterium]